MSSFEFNPFTGTFDIVGSGSGGGFSPDNFSYKKILPLEVKTIPENQQMLFSGDLMVEGTILVNGEIKDVTNFELEEYFYTLIELGKNVFVKANRLLLYKDNIMVHGNLLVYGLMAGV